MEATQLSAIISTRMSHDLIGNIGAVCNAVELMEEGDTDFMSDISNILKVSSRVLSSRLKFFRMAFGLDNSNLTDAETVIKTSEEYIKTLGNPDNNGISIKLKLADITMSRIAMLTLMALTDTIVKGGVIEIEAAAGCVAGEVTSPAKLSQEKYEKMKEIEEGNYPENLALYAPIIALKAYAESQHKTISVKATSGIAIIVR